MTMRIGEPTIQNLGFYGEHYRLRVAWPLDRLKEDEESTNPDAPPAVEALGYRGLVLMMDPNDLPQYARGMPLMHFDVSQAWKDKTRENLKQVVLDRLRVWADTTSMGPAAAEVNAILDSLGEDGG